MLLTISKNVDLLLMSSDDDIQCLALHEGVERDEARLDRFSREQLPYLASGPDSVQVDLLLAQLAELAHAAHSQVSGLSARQVGALKFSMLLKLRLTQIQERTLLRQAHAQRQAAAQQALRLGRWHAGMATGAVHPDWTQIEYRRQLELLAYWQAGLKALWQAVRAASCLPA